MFGQGLHSRSPDLGLLKGFLDRTQSELCVPAIVIEEAANLVRKSLEDVNTKLGAVRRLTGDDGTYRRLEVELAVEAYRKSLGTFLNGMNARVLPYPNIGHDTLAKKALIPNKPFAASGRGYRDALIWFSILELGQGCPQDVSFISDNTDDWCQSRKDLQLHGDLLRDLSSKGIDKSRVRIFASLGDFVQEYAVASLQVASLGDVTRPPDYAQLLIDGKEWIETILPQALVEFLRGFSRGYASVEDVEVLALSAPTDVRPSPIRIIDKDRRLLEFSAKYRIALQFLIKRGELALWSQRLSIHERQDWDESRLRIQATMGIRPLFHMVERGENTEEFSIVSVSTDYYGAFEGLDPVAVMLRQTEVYAPHHTTWGTVKCDSCGAEFGVGCHRLYPTKNEKEYVEKLERILSDDHKAGRPHESLYELGAYSI